MAYNTVELYLVYELGSISVIIKYGTDKTRRIACLRAVHEVLYLCDRMHFWLAKNGV